MIDLRVAVRKRVADEYVWRLFINGVIVTSTTGLKRREARFIRTLIRTAVDEQRAAARERITGG